MIDSSDTKIFAAIITASATITAVALTYLTKLLSDIADKRRVDRTHLMTIRNELVVNQSLAKAIETHTRTYGFRFTDKVWTSNDTSVIYRRGVPTEKILEAYAGMQLFNTLNARYELISEKKDYGPNKDQRLAQEHAEMVNLAEKIDSIISDVIREMKR